MVQLFFPHSKRLQAAIFAGFGLLLWPQPPSSLAQPRDPEPVAMPKSAPTPIPLQLKRAHSILNRLLIANRSIQEPVSLVVRPFAPPNCSPQSAAGDSLDVMTKDIVETYHQPSDSIACLHAFKVPTTISNSSFMSYVIELQRHVDPSSDAEIQSASSAPRTILLNASGMSDQHPTESDPAVCFIARELGALRLNPPAQRTLEDKRVNTTLATRIKAERSKVGQTQSRRDVSGFMVSPLLLLVSKATSGHLENPVYSSFTATPHWRVVKRESPGVAAAMETFKTVPKDLAQSSWNQLNGAFTIAREDLRSLAQSQRAAAEVDALAIVANAGIDPASCLPIFSTIEAGAESGAPKFSLPPIAVEAQQRFSRPIPLLPHRWYPQEDRVEIRP